MDVTQLILDDHQEQRRLFGLLDQVDGIDLEALRAIWAQLATLLEVHAAAEESHFYPALLQLGEGAGDKPNAHAETHDAIKDHNQIRDAIAKTGAYTAGTAEWHQAVAAARQANSDHMAEEERQGLADFRQHAPLQIRHDLGVRFATFMARHRTGVVTQDKDPTRYIEQHR